MTDELKAERELFNKWFTMEFPDFSVDGFLAYHKWLAWQARAKLDRTNTTGGDVDE